MFKDIVTLLPFFVCLFWTAVMFIDFRRSNHPAKILSIFMGVSTILYFSHSLYFYGYSHAYSIIDPFYILVSLSVYPIFYIYIKSLTNKPELSLAYFYFFIPAITLSILSFISHLFFYYLIDVVGKLSRLIFVIQVFWCVVYGGGYIRDYHKKIREYYSSTESRELGWLNRMLFLLFFTGIISVIAGLIGREYFSNSTVLLMLPSILFSTMLFYIGHTGYLQKFSVFDFNFESAEKGEIGLNLSIDNHSKASGEETIENLRITQEKTREKLQKELSILFEQKQIFRRTDLRITDVSVELGSNRSYVSAVVNMFYNTNFSDFVNHYRVEYAKILLLSEENHILDYVADKSGFASVNSLLRAFRKETGTTPGQFRKKRIEK